MSQTSALVSQCRTQPVQWNSLQGRIAGIVFGVVTQALFLWTVVFLFLFLRYGGNAPSNRWAGLIDILLAIGFAVPHSMLLAPPIQRTCKAYFPSGLLGCLHCSVTCLTLLFMFRFWVPIDSTLWNANGATSWVLLGGFYASWVALFYSISLTGFGYQTGLTQWWYWLTKQKSPRRQFVTRGAYQWLRHPIYLSFLGLIWFTPKMSYDHAILTVVWTVYIYLGSYFKDQRLLHFIGKDYREYATRVPGFPLIGVGSLKRWSPVPAPYPDRAEVIQLPTRSEQVLHES